MASVEITISGVLFDKTARTTQPVVLVGEASLTNVGIGGGPIIPPPVDEKPPSIWPSPGYPAHPIAPGGPPPQPTHPIVLPPVEPGGPPVEIWPGVPTHPIVLPPPPTEGTGPEGGKPPPPDGGWGYHPTYGWGYFPMGQSAGPK